MKTITIKDKQFALSISAEKIQQEIQRVAEQINRELDGEKPIFLGVLNGSFMFMSDLMKHVTIPCEVSFIKLSSYVGTTSTGQVTQLLGLNEDIENRTVVVVEDIVDTGITMRNLINNLRKYHPKQIKITSLLQKPEALKCQDVVVDYVAINIPNEFIIGFGLDYDGFGRNLNEIYTLVK